MSHEKAIKSYLLSRAAGVLKPPSGDLRFPYLDPGAGYGGELWEWDAYFTAHALISAFDKFSAEELREAGLIREKVAEHICGSVKNFLAAQESDGYVPIMVAAGGIFCGYFHREHEKGAPLNQHKPFLCQAVLQASEFVGDFGWFDPDRLVAYLEYYERNQYDETSGLFVWQDDVMIGIDNNPTAFFRPPRSCADIYLNCFAVMEYEALAAVLERKGDGRAKDMRRKAEKLREAIDREAWDERDGIYYSQDVGFYRAERKIGDFSFHSGLAPKWNALPIKLRFWGCFLPLYAGICTPARAKRLCEHLLDPDITAKYGVRTVARNEKAYDLSKSENPSNWLGAIWIVANYLVHEGLVRYGFTDTAEKLRKATLAVLGENLAKSGETYESYHPDTGEPNLHPGFLSWNLLALELL